ncbi:MAG: hypothetical protein DRI57_22190 [Deltaproteobacteria bacterium]|nr:MAG: hypothetical protein DRI57_22190 [Deltaproteobacteria bacterium]
MIIFYNQDFCFQFGHLFIKKNPEKFNFQADEKQCNFGYKTNLNISIYIINTSSDFVKYFFQNIGFKGNSDNFSDLEHFYTRIIF